MAESVRVRLDRDRELVLERAKEALGTDDSSEAIERALRHLHQSVDAYEEIKDELTPEQANILSTDEVSINHYPQVRT